MENHEIKYTAKEAMKSVVGYLKDNAVRATQVISIRTISESERKLFVKLFNHWMHKSAMKIFVLAGDVASLQVIEQYIKANYKGIKIVGKATLEEQGVSDDKILNCINGAEADCIVASLSKDFEETFLENNQKSLNAKVWFGVGTNKEWREEKTRMTRVKELVSGVIRKKNKE